MLKRLLNKSKHETRLRNKEGVKAMLYSLVDELCVVSLEKKIEESDLQNVSSELRADIMEIITFIDREWND